MPQSLWREQATQWLQFAPTEMPVGALAPAAHDSTGEDDDPDPDPWPPPAAPAMRAWPRVFPGL